MIQVERLSGEMMFVNPDLVRTVMSKPDTVLTFVDGSTLTILGKAEDFIKKWNEQRGLLGAVKDTSWK